MNTTVYAREEMLDSLYIFRAIFHDAAINGTRVPFFNNCICKIKQ
ncbi:RAxF-45 family protein [Cytobacillus spongiae]|nr:RAxF-45 family protein [Cytobacillus spongiae]